MLHHHHHPVLGPIEKKIIYNTIFYLLPLIWINLNKTIYVLRLRYNYTFFSIFDQKE